MSNDHLKGSAKGGRGISLTPHAQYSSESGFTLLELVIAMSIMTLVIMIIGSGFRLGMRAWDRGEAETGWTQKFRVLSGLFSQQIKSAYPYIIRDDNDEVVAFEGEADSILFVTTLTDTGEGGFKWMKYSHKEGVLYLKEGRLPDKELFSRTSGDEELVDDEIEELVFSYYSLQDDDWKESWDDTENIPAAVKVKISPYEPFLITIPMGLIEKEEDDEKKSDLLDS